MSKTMRSLSLGVTLTIGVALAWGFLAASSLDSFETRYYKDPYRSIEFSVDTNAPVIHESHTRIHEDRIFTLEGKKLDEGKHRNDQFAALDVKSYPDSNHGIRTVTGCSRDQESWYLVETGHGSAYFECYDRSTRLLVGTIGTRGFRDGPVVPSDAFPLATGQIDSRSTTLPRRSVTLIPTTMDVNALPTFMNTGKAVYRVDVCERTAVSIFTSPTPILSILWVANVFNQTEVRRTLIILTNDKLFWLDDGRGTPHEIVLPESLRDRRLFVYKADDGILYAYEHDQNTVRLHAFDADGTPMWTQDVLLDNRIEGTEPTWLPFAVAPLPFVVGMFYLVLLVIVPYFSPESKFLQVQDFNWATYNMGALVICLLAAGLAVLCYRRQRHWHEPTHSALGWSILVFLGGPAGFIAYLTHRNWPTEAVRLPPATVPSPPAPIGTEIYA